MLCEVPTADWNSWSGVKVIVGRSFHVAEDSVNQFHCGAARLVLINGSHSPELVSPSWLTTRSHASHQTHHSAHPEYAFDSGVVHTSVCVCAVCRIWGSPQLWPSNMSVNHAVSVRWSSGGKLSCWLWCDSHRTCMWTTPTVDDEQMIQETVSPSFSRSLPPWPVSGLPGDAGSAAGG